MGTKNLNSATDLITFTRASGGTALRKVGYGTELVTNGDFATNDFTSWSVSNDPNATASSGAANIGKLSGDAAEIRQTLTVVSGQVYKVEFDITSVTGSSLVQLRDGLGTIWQETITAPTSVVFYYTETTTELGFNIRSRTDGVRITIDNVSVKEVLYDQPDGTLQLWNHGNNEPRIEYDATGAVKGLLIEEARTNLVTYSEDFKNNNWFLFDAGDTLTSGFSSPDGSSNAVFFAPDDTDGAHILRRNTSFQNITYSISVFAKASGRRYIQLAIGGASLGTPSYDYRRGVFDLQDGVVISSPTNGSANIESFGNGWYRISATITPVNSGTAKFDIYHADSTTPTQNSISDGNGTDGIYIYGAQVEAGAFPTSYIPTSGSTATRAADFAQIPTSAFGYNNDKGTVVCEFDSASRNFSTIFTLVVGQVAEGMTAIIYPANRVSYQVVTSGVVQVNSNFDAYATASQVSKVATVYAEDDFAAVLNGGAVATDTSGSVPIPTALKLGVYYGAGDFFMSGHIKSIKYYPRRLTNTQLQELTT